MPILTVPSDSDSDSINHSEAPPSPSHLGDLLRSLGELPTAYLDQSDSEHSTVSSPFRLPLASTMDSSLQPQPSLQEIMAEIARLQNLVNSAEARATQAEQRAADLQRHINSTVTAPAPVSAPMDDNSGRPPKPKLPELTKWSGRRSDYRAWVMEARAKLDTDGACIGTEANKIEHLYARMEIDGKNLVCTWIEQNKTKAGTTAETFLRYMDGTFIDPNAANRALSKLADIKQKKDSFALFLPKFERTLAESLVHEDRSRIAYLHSALSQELKLALVSKDMSEDYNTYVSSVAKVASALEQCNYTAPRSYQAPSAALAQTPRNPDLMDWTPTPVAHSALKPLNDSERNYLRANNGCFRCRQVNAGHISRNCPKGQIQARVAKVATPPLIPQASAERMSENGEL